MPLKGFRNRLLTAFPESSIREISPYAEKLTLARGAVLNGAAAPPSYGYFLDSGLVCLVRVTGEGRTAGVGTFGIEAFTGTSAIFELGPTPYQSVVQIESKAWRVPIEIMRDIAERDAKTKVLLGRFASYCRAMFLQIAACNRLHNLRARCSRSLLTLQDNAEGNNFALPHEFFALLLGTNRTSLSLLLEEFQREKILGKRDRSIMILNRSALEQETCECYAVLRAECDRIFHD